MGTPKRRRGRSGGVSTEALACRPPMARREHRQRFWAAIADGLSSEEAGVAAGMSCVVGVRGLSSEWRYGCAVLPCPAVWALPVVRRPVEPVRWSVRSPMWIN